MAEVANHNPQEAGVDLDPKGQEFLPDPDGMIKVETPFGIVTVITGQTDGEPSAMVFGVDSPPELLADTDDTKQSVGFLSNLPKGPFGRIAAGITLAAGAVVGAGAALSACAPATDNPNQPAGIYGTHQSALTLDQVLNVGQGQQIPWSINGDGYASNQVVINGENYLFVARNGLGAGNEEVIYVKCNDLADCFSPNANVQTLQGLGFDAVGFAAASSGLGVFQDQNGNNKFITKPDGFAQTCDIAPNANGILTVSNCAELNPIMSGGPSIFKKDGIPRALYDAGLKIRLRNLFDGINQDLTPPLNPDWAMSCGVGVETDGAVIGSQKQVIQGVVHCRLVTASSWAELAANPIGLQSLNQGSDYLESPRLFGNYLVYTRDNKLWFVEIPAPPQPPEPDAGAPDAGQPIPDANQPDAVVIPPADAGPDVPPIVDAGPAPDAQPNPGDAAGEVADATADAADAAVVIPPEDATPDAGPDLPPAVDAGPDTPPPTPDAGPDTPPDPCSFAKPKITIPPGCQLENCTDPSADITGKCTFSVDLGKAKPVVIELDGTYQIDLLEKIGAHLSGKYQVVDNGNGFNTVAGSFGTGVEGTTYSGEFMVGSNYLLSCQEGTIKVFFIKANGEKELLATLHAGESQTLDMNNPQPEPNPEPTPDSGQPQPEPEKDAGPTQPEPSAADAGSGTETSNPPETTTPPATSKPPSNDGGCSTTGENPNSTGHLATLALALMALGAATRRKQEQQALKPASILTRTFQRVSRSLGLHR